MKLAVRPYAIAGLVLVGVGIIVANPLKPSLPEVQVPATDLTTETLYFDTGDISAQLGILAPRAVGPDGLGIDDSTGQAPILDGLDSIPLQVDVFGSPQDFGSILGGVGPDHNVLDPGPGSR